MRKCYISGPISGLPYEQAVQAFSNASKIIASQGFLPVNPFDNGLCRSMPWAAHMVKDLEMLFASDCIFLLPDWERSRGARIEAYAAYVLDLPFFALIDGDMCEVPSPFSFNFNHVTP